MGSGLPRQAWPHLHGLSRQVSGSVNLGFYDGRKMVLIETVESGAAVQATVRIGQELPLHCTAMGKSVLAFLSEGRLKEVLFRMTLEQITSNTHSDPKSLLGDLDMIRVRGYSVDDEEFIPGVFCVGATVFDNYGLPIAAISVDNVKAVSPRQLVLEEVAMKVVKAANDLSLSLGGGRPGNISNNRAPLKIR